MKIKAAILTSMGQPHPYAQSRPLTVTEIDLDPPGPQEVLVRIRATGLCHSDDQLLEVFFAMPPRQR